MPLENAPLIQCLKRFTGPDVPVFAPSEEEIDPPFWRVSSPPPGRQLPGSGLARHSMLLVGEGCNRMFLVHQGRIIWTFCAGKGWEYDDVWMLSSGNIRLSEEGGVKQVEFFVTNEAQRQWVEEKMLRELETKLRELVACAKVNVSVSVTPVEEAAKVPYMPEEKAKDLMEKNPDVRAFVADMGLDTK